MDSRACVSLVLAAAFVLAAPEAWAESSGKDLGVHGRLYEIREEDMLSWVKRKAGGIDMRALRESMEKRLEESYARHSSVSLDVPPATEERVRYVDPSVEVKNPLYDHEGEMISPMGVVNPLDHVSLSKSILILREDQLERALEETGESGKNAILIITDGDMQRASSLAGRIVYKATPFMLGRFQVEKVPSLVTQKGKKLRVREVNLNGN